MTQEILFEFCPICREKMVWKNMPHLERYNNDCPKGCFAIDVMWSGEVQSSDWGSANSVEEFHRKLKLLAFK